MGMPMCSVPTVPQQQAPTLAQQPITHMVNQNTTAPMCSKRKPNNGTNEPPADGKPKRGRPRKIRKEEK